MTQKYGHLANQVECAQNFACVICETSPVTWTWGDVHGEAMCVNCGTPYQILQRDEEGKLLDLPPILNIKGEWISVLEQYYQETEAFTGLATIMIGRDYPECIEGQRKFYAWLDEHPEMVP
jgi:hypothetical protein